jgi:hypothetical protein
MDQNTQHACITYIACRLITGKRNLHDLENSREIDQPESWK